jgi:hypothetical protein
MSTVQRYGFVYIWYDVKNKMYYVGCHWGTIDDGYVCSSRWMKQAYLRRPHDFKRRILKTKIATREEMFNEELRWLHMIKDEEIKPNVDKPRYYNLNIKNNEMWHKYPENIKSISSKISIRTKEALQNQDIRDKISTAKLGKHTGPRDPSVGAAISKAKKGKKFTEEHKAALRAVPRKPHTDEWKAENSRRLKEQWETGVRKSHGPLTDEHREKIRAGNVGKTRDEAYRDNLRVKNSKSYVITFDDGASIVVDGLKRYGVDNGIPYVTLFKAAQRGTPIKRRGISSVRLSSDFKAHASVFQ